MGFFSWITQDTKRSISNRHSSRPPFPVTMTDNRGNRWHETGYDGYGVFGGKPYYELLAEMNGLPPDFDTGVDLAFSTQPHITPNLTEDPEQISKAARQGHFVNRVRSTNQNQTLAMNPLPWKGRNSAS